MAINRNRTSLLNAGLVGLVFHISISTQQNEKQTYIANHTYGNATVFNIG
jgi:hypothetical protein